MTTTAASRILQRELYLPRILFADVTPSMLIGRFLDSENTESAEMQLSFIRLMGEQLIAYADVIQPIIDGSAAARSVDNASIKEGV